MVCTKHTLLLVLLVIIISRMTVVTDIMFDRCYDGGKLDSGLQVSPPLSLSSISTPSHTHIPSQQDRYSWWPVKFNVTHHYTKIHYLHFQIHFPVQVLTH